MKIQRFKMGFSPSVKGYYIAIIGLFFSTVLSAQYNTRWELGIALKPLSWTDEPYCFMAKRVFNKAVALRGGIGINFKQNDVNYAYSHPYPDTNNAFSYEYAQVNKYFYFNSFLGIQYGKHKNRWLLYGATDFVNTWKAFNESVSHVQYRAINIRKGDIFIHAPHSRKKYVGLGIRQSIGINYLISSDISISIEAAVAYMVQKVSQQDFLYALASDGQEHAIPTDGLSFIYQSSAIMKSDNYLFAINGISLISINYHF